MTEYAGRGDARRSMALLWGVQEPPARGPKQGLSVQVIAATAIELADREGFEGTSMRKVAEALGRSTMSLYTYVPGKGELFDLMLDTVLAELAGPFVADDGWRAAAERLARSSWDFYERHPWVLQISGTRPALGPNEIGVQEASLATFDGLGLSGLEMTRLSTVLASFVRGAAKNRSDARTAERVTGMSDDEWWWSRAPLLEEIVGDTWEDRFPVTARLQGDEGTFDAPYEVDETIPYTEAIALDTFEFGLQRVLDGFAVFIEQH